MLRYRAKPCDVNFELESDYARTNLVGRRATWRSGLLVADPPHSGGVEGSLNVIEKNIHAIVTTVTLVTIQVVTAITQVTTGTLVTCQPWG